MGSKYTFSHSPFLCDRQTLANWNSTTPDTAKTYWANGLLKSIDNGISKSDYAYNTRNLLTSETQKQRRPVDVLDRSEATWGAAPKGRGATLSQTLSGRPARVVSYDYDAVLLRRGYGVQDGNRSTQTLSLESSSLGFCVSIPQQRRFTSPIREWTSRARLHSVSVDGSAASSSPNAALRSSEGNTGRRMSETSSIAI